MDNRGDNRGEYASSIPDREFYNQKTNPPPYNSRLQKMQRLADRDTEGRLECFYCGDGLTPETGTFDHIIPRSKGGSNRQDNLCNSCRPCNENKADIMPEFTQFNAGQYKLCECCKKHPATYCSVCSGR